MSAQQQEALQLAELLDRGQHLVLVERKNAAAELRRLHAENEGLLASRENLGAAIERQYFSAELLADRVMRLEAQRDDLLEALRSLHAAMACHDGTPEETLALDAARAVIAKVTGEAA